VFTDEYDSAYSLCNLIIAAYPEDPSGYFFRAYTMMVEMTEEHENVYQEDYFRLLDSVELLVSNIIDTCGNDCKAWCHWYLGNVWAYRSLWKARFGSPASAYKLATKARKSYEAGLACDSSLYDNYAGLGAVHYWKSAKGGFLRTLGIIKDEREKGIAELKLAAESSILSRETVQKTLIAVLNDYRQHDSAIAYAEEMLIYYPNARTFLWSISWAYYYKKDYQKACEYFKRLRRNLAERPGNYYKLIECDARIVRCLEKLKETEKAGDWSSQAKEYVHFASEEVRDKQKDNIKYLTKMANR
jgi:hypothetical protein